MISPFRLRGPLRFVVNPLPFSEQHTTTSAQSVRIMVELSFLYKMSPGSSNRLRKTRKHIDINGGNKINRTKQKISTDRREQSLSNQILQISNDGYDRGVQLFISKKYLEASECFEDALAARLVLFGPDSEDVLEIHQQLKQIAHIQGDARKAAHHKLKISQIHSACMRHIGHTANPIDWRILCNGD